MTIPSTQDSPELELRRFLYLSTSMNHYITGNPERYKRLERHEITALDTLLKDDPAKVIRIVSAVNGENLVPRRETIFFVLAAALTSSVTISDVYRRELYTVVLYACRNDEEFFCFIKHMTTLKKSFSSGLNKVIARYYKNKEPMDLIRDVCKKKGYHCWTHKDLIKLSHIKPDNTLLEIAIVFIVRGLAAAEALVAEKKEGKDMIKHIKKNLAYKQSESAEEVVKYMIGQNTPFELIPAKFNHNATCLAALLKYIGVKDLLPLLMRLYKAKLIKTEGEAQNRVVRILSDSSKVKASNVHPYEVYIAMKFFEKGGKPRDPRLITHLETKEKAAKAEKNITEFTPTNWARVDPTNCPPVVAALKKCFTLSYQNVTPTNRRFLITVEVSSDMDKPCLTSKMLTAYEAAAVEVLTYVNTEKHVMVAVFNGEGITEVPVKKSGSVEDTIKAFKDAAHSEVQMGAPLVWARINKKPFDVFINIQHSPNHSHWVKMDQPLLSPIAAYVKYKAAMNMSSTKLVLHSFDAPRRTVIPETSIDIRGFDKYVPRVIEAYIKNLV